MSYTAKELLKLASDYDNLATKALIVTAEKKEKKKLDPKAKVRNRGNVCVPAESAKDKKDHFPINNADQARNALARVHQYSSVPDWYKGSLSGLQALVARKVKAKYPKIDVGGKKEKKASEYYDSILSKFAQVKDQAQAKNLTDSLIQSIGAINITQWPLDEVKRQANDYAMNGFRNFQSQMISQEQYGQIVAASQKKMQEAEAAAQQAKTITVPTVEIVDKAKPKGDGWAGPRIDSVFQTMLGTSPDGKLGPQTQTALEMYKKSVGIPNAADEQGTYKKDSKKTNQQAFESLKQRPEYKVKRPMVWDDNSNTYKQPEPLVRENPF